MNQEMDELPPADPAAALSLIQQQQAAATRRLTPDVRVYYWPWGTAWLIGFGLFFLRFGPDGRVFVNLPHWLPLTALFTLLAAAAAVTAIAGVRAYGQIAGDSSRRGSWYGWAGFLGYAGLVATLVQVTDSLPDGLQTLVWAGSMVGFTGALHIAGGAIWLDRGLFTLGVWVSLINIVGVLAGPGWHLLIVALAGGGGMLVAGAIASLSGRCR